MRLFSEGNSRGILVIGSGLVGSSITDALRTRGLAEVLRVPISWTSSLALSKKFDQMSQALTAYSEISVIWAAGKAGFAASEAETASEMEMFSKILQYVSKWAQRVQARFLYVSSAGGLYEGERRVGADLIPQPKRSYGVLKLKQEQVVQEVLGHQAQLRVYRPSTIYGFSSPGQRVGLISALIRNGLMHRVTSIHGNPDTMRDYVWVRDIARYLAQEALLPQWERGASKPFFLVSSMPVSISQIKAEVEKRIHRQTYVCYSAGEGNRAHMTFQPELLPDDWRPCSIEEGIGRVIQEYFAH